MVGNKWRKLEKRRLFLITLRKSLDAFPWIMSSVRFRGWTLELARPGFKLDSCLLALRPWASCPCVLVRVCWLQKNRNSAKPVRVKKGIMGGHRGSHERGGQRAALLCKCVRSVPWTRGPACGGTEIQAVLHCEEERRLYVIVSKAWTEPPPGR